MKRLAPFFSLQKGIRTGMYGMYYPGTVQSVLVRRASHNWVKTLCTGNF